MNESAFANKTLTTPSRERSQEQDLEDIEGRINPQWWDAENPSQALKESFLAFVERDRLLLQQDERYAFLFTQDASPSKRVMIHIAAKTDASKLREKAEIAITLKNVRLSVFLDDVIDSFCKDAPMPREVFLTKLKTLVASSNKISEFVHAYDHLLHEYETDLGRREGYKNEKTEDLLIRYDDTNTFYLEGGKGKSEAKLTAAGKALKSIREAAKAGYLERTKGPKSEDNTLDKEIESFRLPFVDVVIIDGGNDQLHLFELTEKAKERGLNLENIVYSYKKRAEAIYDNPLKSILQDIRGGYDGWAGPAGKDGREIIVMSPEYTSPLDDEERQEQFYKELSHIRHELRHVFDSKLTFMNSARMPSLNFYFPEKIFPRDRRSEKGVEEALPIETEHMLTEIKGCALNGRHLALGHYLNESLQRLKNNTRNGGEEGDQINRFEAQWQTVIDFLRHNKEVFEDLENPTKENRKRSLITYHCISNAETAEEVLLRLKHALAWISLD